MQRNPLAVRLPKPQLDRIGVEAAKLGIPRNRMIVWLLNRGLRDLDKAG